MFLVLHCRTAVDLIMPPLIVRQQHFTLSAWKSIYTKALISLRNFLFHHWWKRNQWLENERLLIQVCKTHCICCYLILCIHYIKLTSNILAGSFKCNKNFALKWMSDSSRSCFACHKVTTIKRYFLFNLLFDEES